MMIMMNCVVVWLTDERRLALFPAGTTVRDPHHRESPTRREQGLNLRKTEFRVSSMRLCSIDNHCTTASRFLMGRHWIVQA